MKFNNKVVVRTVVAVIGLLLIILAFAMDALGFGSPGSFGIGQLLVLGIGISGLLAGLLGKKVINLYRTIAILLLNTLILFAIIELVAIVVARSGQNYDTETYSLPYYAGQEWTEQYFNEAFAAEFFQYEPYLIWKHQPFNGDLMTLNADGLRETPGAACTADAYKVFAFGGSTMLGWGAPNWGTIPAYLQTNLSEVTEQDICIINYGQSGYVSTQSLMALMLALQNDNVPSLVIFYDGVNEVQAAYESGLAGTHVNLAPITDRFEQRENPLLSFIKTTRSYTLAENWISQQAQRQAAEGTLVVEAQLEAIEIEDISNMVADIYLNNYVLVETLADEYGFDFLFVLQPHLAVGQKSLTVEESDIFSTMDPLLITLAQNIYRDISVNQANNEDFANFQDVFAETPQQIWIDTGGHITPEGNLLVANEIYSLLDN